VVPVPAVLVGATVGVGVLGGDGGGFAGGIAAAADAAGYGDRDPRCGANFTKL
jgi:hypothetical protein